MTIEEESTTHGKAFVIKPHSTKAHPTILSLSAKEEALVTPSSFERVLLDWYFLYRHNSFFCFLPLSSIIIMSSWLEKLTLLIGPRGYSDCMRRSLQSVILYEAKRCLEADLPSLKPFQRKVALMDQAAGLIESLPFLMPHQREEILWRTATSKEQINGDIAYKRIQQINKELQKLCTQIKPFIVPSTSHQEWVNQLEQHLFVSCRDYKKRRRISVEPFFFAHWWCVCVCVPRKVFF